MQSSTLRAVVLLALGLVFILAIPLPLEAARRFGGKITGTVTPPGCSQGFVVGGRAGGITIYQSGRVFGGKLGVGKWTLGLAGSPNNCNFWNIIIAGVSL